MHLGHVDIVLDYVLYHKYYIKLDVNLLCSKIVDYQCHMVSSFYLNQ